ncbi:hypothetical protein [uncultured Roseobacter sp.]|uniref:hypothetical protein n=1 Tax=uncultured Roseobacter sp. TaxID=114847 RepID=UPI00260D513C|nr:hypothetical protein [uncultured Roseobacter sp.]
MRTIEIDLDVFAAIWANREPNENDENTVLKRLLCTNCDIDPKLSKKDRQDTKMLQEAYEPMGKIRWIDDVESALRELGGQATLHRIYQQVRKRRENGKRSLPPSLEAIVRRSIEEQSSDSESFKGIIDLFKHIGRGEWKLRRP